MSKIIKTIKDFKDGFISDLKKDFDFNARKGGFNLTEYLDGKQMVEFNQEIVNEIVLWKVNRYVNIKNSSWFESFNDLKNINELNDTNIEEIKKILCEMLSSYMIQLPMASTLLRFRNPRVFQVIDERTCRIMFGDYPEKIKMYHSSSVDKRITVYFEYLATLKAYCEGNKLDFFEADRILWQFDIKENQNFNGQEKNHRNLK